MRRDPRSLGMALAIPALMMFLFGYALTLDVDRVPLAVWDQSGTPESRDLVSRFDGSRYFDVRPGAGGYPGIERAVLSREIMAALVIPRDFAAETAARALREERIANETLEVWLGRGLVALLLLAGAVAIRVYGGEALLGFSFSVPDGATPGIQSVLGWSIAVAACVGISSVFKLAGKR